MSLQQQSELGDIWQLSEHPRPEAINLLDLSDEQLFDYADSLQADVRALRLVVSESLTTIVRLTHTLLQRDRRIAQQRDEIRGLVRAVYVDRPAA